MARILLVDDEANILESLERRLKRTEHGVLLAGSAKDALRILDMVDVDVVVTDENMPGMSGTAFLVHVREKHPRVLRFMLTGTKDVMVVSKAVNEAAVTCFLVKPMPGHELLQHIEEALARRSAS